ncbi:MAG: NUDIX hydrolase [Candidatus Nanopelagicales bacterium]
MRRPTKHKIHAAGVALLREVDGQTQVCVIHRPRHKDWSLPKGKLDTGEPIIVGGFRESWEETGITVRLGVPLKAQEYKVNGDTKIVHYWRATIGQEGKFEPNGEVDKMEWFPIDKALKKLTHRRDIQTVKEAVKEPETTALVILRHTKAMRRAMWSNKSRDMDRPLAVAGRQQAIALTEILNAYGISRVYTSPANRCVSTVAPYAQDFNHQLRLEPLFSEVDFPLDKEAALARLAKISTKKAPTVLCTHRPVLPDLLKALAEQFKIKGGAKVFAKPLKPGEFYVLHRQRIAKGEYQVVAVERHGV